MNDEQKYVENSLRSKKIDFIKEIVSGYYGQPITDYDRKVRERQIIKLKYVTIYIILSKMPVHLVELGKVFNYNHATVIHANKQIKGYLTFDMDLKKEVDELNRLIDHKLTIIDGKLNLDEDYNYINLNDCVGVKLSNDKTIVFSGFTPQEINKVSNVLGLRDVREMKFDNTGMYLLKKLDKKQTQHG